MKIKKTRKLRARMCKDATITDSIVILQIKFIPLLTFIITINKFHDLYPFSFTEKN